MSTEPKIVLVINDTHCGSEFGLLPDHVELNDGRTLGYGNNLKLKFLWESWLQMREDFFQVAGNEPFTLVLNGDLIEGTHHKSEEKVAAKMIEHLTIAEVAVGPWVELAENTVVTRGTECHTADWESYFCERFGIPKAKDFQQFTVNGTLIDVRHHMPCAASMYAESAALSKVVVNNISQAQRAGHPIPRILLRGHRHTTGDFSDGEFQIIIPGPWQYGTRYCYKTVPDSVPRFSAYALDFRGKREGSLPATHRFCYTPPFEVLNS